MFLFKLTFRLTIKFVLLEKSLDVYYVKMIPAPPPISVPESYETVQLKDVKVSHHPPEAPSATPVIIVTLNRPEKQNAYTIHMMHDFEKIYPMFDVDERVKVIVLTDAGRTFCAGADLEIGFNSAAADPERNMDRRDSYDIVCVQLEHSLLTPAPTEAAV